jgi:HAD superfamily hydrolase (TIGR01549 family)
MTCDTSLITAILFDWDGTVVDSAQLGLVAFQKSFAALGLEFHEPTYQTAYSPNWYLLYEKMGVPKDKWETADALWLQHYGEQTATAIEGADLTLRELQAKGYRMGVVSSGSEARVKREMESLALTEFFDVVVCNEHMVNKKPHPEGLETAMQRLRLTGAETCYVGDSPEDIEMGKRASLLTVGVRSSYPTSWKLQTAKPDIYLESFTDLTNHF